MRMWSLTTFSAIFLLTGLLAAPIQAQTIDPNSGEGFVALNRKIQCSTEDSSPQVFEWSGYGYSRVPGEPDRRIFACWHERAPMWAGGGSRQRHRLSLGIQRNHALPRPENRRDSAHF